MAIKLAVAKRKNGDEIYFKTSLEQVIGLSDALAGKQAQLTQAQLDAVNSGVTSSLVGELETKLPNLADKDFVNSTVQTMSAAPLAYDASGNPFPTKSALDNATAFYHGGTAKTPDEHDFVTVLADEEHGGAQTRYSYANGGWTFQYLVNDQPFTAAQNAAINSGVTAEKVTEMDNLATYVEGLGTVYFVQAGADLSAFKDTDLIIELDN